MTNNNDDRIATLEIYRGVGIHDEQPAQRIAQVVKPAIDHVIELRDPVALAKFASNPLNPPEARLLAAAKVEATFEVSALDRVQRPNVNLVLLRAQTAGLDSRRWRSHLVYGTLTDQNIAARREVPLRQ